MIETECFQELNQFYINGQLAPDLRPECVNLSNHNSTTKNPGFFSKLFRRKVGFFKFFKYILPKLIYICFYCIYSTNGFNVYRIS